MQISATSFKSAIEPFFSTITSCHCSGSKSYTVGFIAFLSPNLYFYSQKFQQKPHFFKFTGYSFAFDQLKRYDYHPEMFKTDVLISDNVFALFLTLLYNLKLLVGYLWCENAAILF